MAIHEQHYDAFLDAWGMTGIHLKTRLGKGHRVVAPASKHEVF
jgi:hypothetical protein